MKMNEEKKRITENKREQKERRKQSHVITAT